MSFSQLTQRDSLSGTFIGLNANRHKLYHLGIGVDFSRTTLSRVDESIDGRIYEELFLLFYWRSAGFMPE
jgi:hypothetical protein